MSEHLLVKHVSIRQALQYVANNPEAKTDPIDTPVWELVSRVLFEMATSPDVRVRGSMSRARKAQEIISDRLVGRRRPGTHPSGAAEEVEFRDLTKGAITE